MRQRSMLMKFRWANLPLYFGAIAPTQPVAATDPRKPCSTPHRNHTVNYWHFAGDGESKA